MPRRRSTRDRELPVAGHHDGRIRQGARPAVEYHDVFTEETWGRSDDLFYSIGHVNLSLLRPKVDPGFARNEGERMTIDFLPPRDLRGLRTRVVGEDTIVAMYMNNRAVEAFARGQIDDAYWWARGACGATLNS